MSLFDTLSEREKEVAALLLQGKSNKQIAQALGISLRTVEFHTKHIYEKLGVSSRAEAIIRLTEDHLRETAGQKIAQPAVEIRETAVATNRELPENDRKSLSFFRRITMKKAILIVVVALFTLACIFFGFFSSLGLALFQIRTNASTRGPVGIEQMVVEPTYTPWVTPTTAQATYTPIQPTLTPILPTSTPLSTPIQPAGVPTGEQYDFGGVRFAVDPGIASRASGQVVLENAGTPDSPYWELHPQHTRIVLEGYAVGPSAFQPVIAVYPVADYRRVSEPSQKMLDNLTELLAQKPAEVDQLPYLPVINAVQVFHSNLAYLDFQNGSGVRFLTQYDQYPAPVNNYDLFYTFQGLTSDGRYVVSITLPVNHPSLPAHPDVLSTGELEAIARDAEQYYPAQVAALAAQPDSSFTPDLAKLDALIASLRYEP